MNAVTRAIFSITAVLVAGLASAAEVDGKWAGMVGESEIKFTLKADGERLTGTLDNAAQAGVMEIKEGKIKGSDISFHVVRTLNNAETKVEWTGKLAGDELKLQRAAVGGNAPADVVAKRVKPDAGKSQ
jgi:hypothetical protein